VVQTEDAFEPLEEQFDPPAVSANQGDELRLDFQVGGQQQLLSIRFHANHADRLALPLVAEFDFPNARWSWTPALR